MAQNSFQNFPKTYILKGDYQHYNLMLQSILACLSDKQLSSFACPGKSWLTFTYLVGRQIALSIAHLESDNEKFLNQQQNLLVLDEWTAPGRGGGYSVIWAIQVCAAPKGMVINRVSI